MTLPRTRATDRLLDLLTFFDGDRPRLLRELARAAAGQVCEFEALLRPRERRRLAVRIDLAVVADGPPGAIEWIIELCSSPPEFTGPIS